MAAENVGSVVYTVEADTSKLVDGGQDVNKTLDKMQSSFNKTDKSAKQAEFQMTKTAAAVQQVAKEARAAESPLGNMSKLLLGMVSIQGAMGLVQLAEGYAEMAERVQMASGSAADYELVQTRLLDTANKTYRSLKESQETYIRTADSLRTMGYNTEQALDITDSLSYAFVRSATSVERAEIAMGAFSRSLSKGRVDSDAWEMMMISIPSIAQDMSSALGIAAEEVRKLGAEGKLTTAQLTEGLRKSLDVNKAAADGMATTVKDAFTQMRNNLSMYIGEANMASGATGLLSKSIMLFGENIDTVVKLLMTLGAGALAKYIAQMGLAVAASARAAFAARAEAAAELEKARALVASTAAAAANATAMQHLTGSNAAATAAVNAHKTAQTQLAAATAAARGAGVGLTAILGGPVGIAALAISAAAGILLFSDNTSKAIPPVEQLTDSIEKLTKAQLENRRLQAQDAIEQLKKSAQESSASIKGLEKDYEALNEARARGANISQKELDSVKRTMVEAKAENDQRIKDLQAAYDAEMKLAKAQEDRAKASTNISGPAAKSDPEVLKNLAAMREQLELAKLEGEARAKLQALQKLGANATAAERAEAEKLATEIYRLENARKGASAAAKDQAKATKDAAAEAKKAAEEQQRGYESAGQVLQDLALKIQLASLEGKELAITQAVLAAGEYATPEQIAAIQALSAQLYEVEKRKEKLDEITRAGGLKKWIMGDEDPLFGGALETPQDQLNAEAQKEEERYAAQRTRLTQEFDFLKNGWAEYFAILEEMNTKHAERMNQIELAKLSLKRQQYADAFGSVADVLKKAQGEQSSAYRAMFAVSKSFAIADATVNAYNAISKAWASAPFPANLAAVAATVPQVMGVVSSISGVSAGRQYGGPVNAGSMYRINENGAPEVFNAANGQQYMLPNRRGEVVSNKDATSSAGGGAPTIVVNLIESKERAGTVQQEQGSNDEYIVNVVVSSIMGDGPVGNAVQGKFGLSPQGV